MNAPGRRYRAGESIEDFCRACKTDRMHTVVAADENGQPIRVSCGFCHSEHNYRGGPRVGMTPGSSVKPVGADARSAEAANAPRDERHGGMRESTRRPAASASPEREPFPIVSDRERTAPPVAIDDAQDVELLLRR